MLKHLVLIIITITIGYQSFASHLTGGEMNYEYNGTNYTLTLKLYGVCDGPVGAFANYSNVNCQSINCGLNFVKTLPQVSIDTFKQQFCNADTTCGNLFNYMVAVTYRDTINLAHCSDWNLSYSACCLSIQMANYVSNGNTIFIVDSLDNSLAENTCPKIKNNFPMYMGTNQLSTYCLQSVDADGDSVIYEFAAPLNSANQPFAYMSGFSDTTPLGTTSINVNNRSQIYNNNQTIQLESGNAGFYIICLKISDYRNGNLVGYSLRSWPLLVTTNTFAANPLPDPGTVYTYLTHPGQSQTISLQFDDSTATDSVFVSFDTTNSFNYLTTGTPNLGFGNGTISWTTPNNLNPVTTPYFYIYALAKSNACPNRGYTWITLIVYTAPYNATDSVWPGDANNDYVVNMYDALALAVGYNDTGALRNAATQNWNAEYCANWVNYILPSSVNAKHADCNGDGVVDNSDLSAIYTNYSLTHPKTHGEAAKTTSNTYMYFDLSGVTLYPGATVNVPIRVGNMLNKANHLYGVASRININGINLASPIAINNTANCLSTISNELGLAKTINNNTTDWTLARIDHKDTTGYGLLTTLQFTVPANAQLGQMVKFSFNETEFINKDGYLLNGISAYDDSMAITVAVPHIANTISKIITSPNPVLNQLNIANAPIGASIRVYDVVGRVVYSGTANSTQASINTSAWERGAYFVELMGEDGSKEVRKVVK